VATAALVSLACAPPPATLCWRSLAPPTGDENLGLAMTSPWLASDGADDVWLTWKAPGSRILRWTRGQWSEIPVPVPPGAKGAEIPVVATGHNGAVVVAALTNGKDGTTPLYVARSNGAGWDWLGPPLISAMVPFTHVNDVAIALDAAGRPVVAWSEEVHVRLGGLFAARWDGASWKRILDLHPPDTGYHLSLGVAVDAADRVWLTWLDGGSSSGRPRLRVSRLDKSGWIDIGRRELEALDLPPFGGDKPTLAVGRDGTAWLAWVAAGVHSERSLAIARWNGVTWTAIPPPDLPEGHIAGATMILKGGAPTVAWSQPDESDNRHLYLADLDGDRWRVRFAGFHLAEGVSEVGDINLAAGSTGSLYISWDEAGEDRRRNRLMHAYACAAGEKPAMPPKALRERDTWPTTVDEAARLIVSKLSPADKEKVRKTPESDLILFHHGWGTGIRNSLGLWRGNERLLASCARGQGQPVHPDDCSMQIIEAVWKLLQTPAR
jgi:hypothetical protein